MEYLLSPVLQLIKVAAYFFNRLTHLFIDNCLDSAYFILFFLNGTMQENLHLPGGPKSK